MQVEEFFDLFLLELQQNTALSQYYKFHADATSFSFRKAYFCQRLQYIKSHIGHPEKSIWDCGCGYGTTALFLALNGYRVYGSTLEFYFKEISQRLHYWSAFGDVSGFCYQYEDLFETNYHQEFDTIILQDTLHHVEPIERGLEILAVALRPRGRLLIIEENGANIIQNLILIKKRGFQKTKRVYDEALQKMILLGNENIRSLKQWKQLLERAGFELNEDTIQHIRFYLPWFIHGQDTGLVALKEQHLASRSSLLRKYFFFGINFEAVKAD